MLIKTSELQGIVLDWCVAKCEGGQIEILRADGLLPAQWCNEGNINCEYSTNWAQSGPIIEREAIELLLGEKEAWRAIIGRFNLTEKPAVKYGSTPLVAAMRCYVAGKLGDVVDVPDELANRT